MCSHVNGGSSLLLGSTIFGPERRFDHDDRDEQALINRDDLKGIVNALKRARLAYKNSSSPVLLMKEGVKS